MRLCSGGGHSSQEPRYLGPRDGVVEVGSVHERLAAPALASVAPGPCLSGVENGLGLGQSFGPDRVGRRVLPSLQPLDVLGQLDDPVVVSTGPVVELGL